MDLIDTIETPEGIRLERRLAGIGSRVLAGFVDGLIITVALGVLAVGLVVGWGNPAVWLSGEEGAMAWGLAVVIGFLFAVYWGYFALCEWFMNGQSPGKRSQKLRVVKEGGGPISFLDIAIRNLLRIVDGLGFYAVAGLTMFLTRKVQRLGDLAAGTVIVSEAKADYAATSNRPRILDDLAAAWPAGLSATGMTPDEFRILRNYCLRRGELTWEARERLLPKLVGPVLQRTGRRLPDTSYVSLEQYVDALMQRAYASEAVTWPDRGPG